MTLSSYTCPLCGRTSYNPNDVREQYCGACHQWAEPYWMQDIRIALRRIEAGRPSCSGPGGRPQEAEDEEGSEPSANT